jgi:hypothetical protein
VLAPDLGSPTRLKFEVLCDEATAAGLSRLLAHVFGSAVSARIDHARRITLVVGPAERACDRDRPRGGLRLRPHADNGARRRTARRSRWRRGLLRASLISDRRHDAGSTVSVDRPARVELPLAGEADVRATCNSVVEREPQTARASNCRPGGDGDSAASRDRDVEPEPALGSRRRGGARQRASPVSAARSSGQLQAPCRRRRRSHG